MKITQNEIRLAENLQKFKEEFKEQATGLFIGFQTAINLFTQCDINNTTDKILEILKRICILLDFTIININNSSDDMRICFKWKTINNKEYGFYSVEDSIKSLMYILCLYRESFVKENFLMEYIIPEHNEFTQFFYRLSYRIEEIVEEYVKSSDN